MQVEIPQSALPRFSKKYFDLFGTRGFRHDPQDRGGEYRSVLGLPGGVNSPLFDVVKQAAQESPGGMKLFLGKGDEPDTIGDKAVLVYDSDKFPFTRLRCTTSSTTILWDLRTARHTTPSSRRRSIRASSRTPAARMISSETSEPTMCCDVSVH